MSIYGISNTNIPRTPSQLPIRDGSRPQVQQPASRPVQMPAQRGPQKPGAATQSVPVEPPPGTDPALWSVLSGDERAFFAKAGAMGPLTYGRALQESTSAQLPAARGGRLDVKI